LVVNENEEKDISKRCVYSDSYLKWNIINIIFHSIFTFIPIFYTSIRNHASIGFKAMSTNKDRIEKLELAFQKLAEETKKLAEENTKRFEDLEKSLENIASSLNEGFSGGLCKTNEENSQNSIKGLEHSFHEVMVNLPKTKGETSRNNTVHIPSPKSAQFSQSDVPPAFATPLPFHAYPNYDQGHKQVHTTPSPPTGTNINSKTPRESPLAKPAQIRPLHRRALPCVEFCRQRPPPKPPDQHLTLRFTGPSFFSEGVLEEIHRRKAKLQNYFNLEDKCRVKGMELI
jgi:hypothetical protein